jgi:hypothetical protein
MMFTGGRDHGFGVVDASGKGPSQMGCCRYGARACSYIQELRTFLDQRRIQNGGVTSFL